MQTRISLQLSLNSSQNLASRSLHVFRFNGCIVKLSEHIIALFPSVPGIVPSRSIYSFVSHRRMQDPGKLHEHTRKEPHRAPGEEREQALEDNRHPPTRLVIHLGKPIIDPIRQRHTANKENRVERIRRPAISDLDARLAQICRHRGADASDRKPSAQSSRYQLPNRVTAGLDDGADDCGNVTHDDCSAPSDVEREECYPDGGYAGCQIV